MPLIARDKYFGACSVWFTLCSRGAKLDLELMLMAFAVLNAGWLCC